MEISTTISLTTIRSLSVSSTGTALDQAHLLASAFLDQERLQIQGRISNLTEQLKSVKGEAALNLELQIRRSKVEYDLSSIETHRLFNDGKHVDPTKVLILVLYGLVFPAMIGCLLVDSANLVPVLPEIIITRDFDTLNTDHYTLLMTDLDRPNLDTKSYEEWCHWLVLSRAKSDSQSENLIPGNVVFLYSTIQHSQSSPCTSICGNTFQAAQQDHSTPNIDMSKLQLQAETDRAQMANAQKDLPLSSRFHETEGEMALQMRERFLVAPTMKFAKDYNLELAGFGFITSSWVPETSHVFTGLNIHEPVYGKSITSFPKL
ncbi:hypothetical protein BSLG_005901 [Batrachochytrium salamandrivorans]|nr:hypothetical protein BSLG_005901 [Batrachochytrium salamandrivorans]